MRGDPEHSTPVTYRRFDRPEIRIAFREGMVLGSLVATAIWVTVFVVGHYLRGW